MALAFNCVGIQPCSKVTTTSDEPTIVKVLPANLARVDNVSPYAVNRLPPSTFVIVGLKPGKTTVRLRSNQGPTTIAVHVSDKFLK